MLSASPPERTGSRPPRRRPSTYGRPDNTTSLILLPAESEAVADMNGDAIVYRWPGNVFVFRSLLRAWPDVLIRGEVAARRWAASRWPKAGWQTAEANEIMISHFEVEARMRVKEEQSPCASHR